MERNMGDNEEERLEYMKMINSDNGKIQTHTRCLIVVYFTLPHETFTCLKQLLIKFINCRMWCIDELQIYNDKTQLLKTTSFILVVYA